MFLKRLRNKYEILWRHTVCVYSISPITFRKPVMVAHYCCCFCCRNWNFGIAAWAIWTYVRRAIIQFIVGWKNARPVCSFLLKMCLRHRSIKTGLDKWTDDGTDDPLVTLLCSLKTFPCAQMCMAYLPERRYPNQSLDCLLFDFTSHFICATSLHLVSTKISNYSVNYGDMTDNKWDGRSS